MMSRKHYEAVALIIRTNRYCPDPQKREKYIIEGLIKWFELDNPRFDKEKFIREAGLSDYFME